jgi:hypothetical protein
VFIYTSPFHASYLFFALLTFLFRFKFCIEVFSIRLFSHLIFIKFPVVSALSLSSSLLSFAVHAFVLYLWSFFLVYVSFISILYCCLSFSVFIVIRRSDEIRRIDRKCTDLPGVLRRQLLRHIWPVASDWARFAPPCSECCVCCIKLERRPQFAVGRSARRVLPVTFRYIQQ